MSRQQLPPVAAVISFIDCINRGDSHGLGTLMTDDHELTIFGEPTVRSKARIIEAWKGYLSAYPSYVIHPEAVAEPGEGSVAVLGHTTGSHLEMSDEQERLLSVIWLAEVRAGQLSGWHLLEDTPDRRV